MKPEKTRCGGQWTEARFASFVKSALRSASNRWQPKYQCKKDARTARNTYTCAGCKNSFGSKSVRVDHIDPVVDTKRGFRTWDEYIERMFVERDGYQLLCTNARGTGCHDFKTALERTTRKETKTNKT